MNIQSNSTNSNVPATTVVKIDDITCSQLSNAKWFQRSGSLYVKFILDGQQKHATVPIKGRPAISWVDSLTFDALESSELEIQIWAHHRVFRDKYIGESRGTIESLLKQGPTDVVRDLYKSDGRGVRRKIQTTVGFSIMTVSPESNVGQLQMGEALSQAHQTVNRMKAAPAALDNAEAAVGVATGVADAVKSVPDALDSLLKKIKLFTGIVDQLSEIHPYAATAWTILSAVPKSLDAQHTRDVSICGLLNIIDDTHSFVLEAEPLKTIESHRNLITLITQQTVECAYFIRDYACEESFLMRTAKHIMSNAADGKIKQYKDKFKDLKAKFQERAVIQIETIVCRSLNQVESLATNISLSGIRYAGGAGYDPDKRCIPGTREVILDEVHQWINQPDGEDVPRILVFTGVAGFGKSAVAHTIAHHYYGLKRLGSSVCFLRADQARRHPGVLLSTITRDMANLDPQWKAALWNVVKDNDALQTTTAITRQMDSFILEPAKALTIVGPIVIVIDALDESGDASARGALLQTLGKRASELPPNFRILLTARPEADIIKAFENKPHIQLKSMDAVDEATTDADIALFIERQLSGISSVLENRWPNNQWCRMLVEASDHLFQWAATACLAIREGPRGYRPAERLVKFVEHGRGLDNIYMEVLRQIFDEDDAEIMSRFRQVMGSILAVKEPLSMLSHAELRCEGDDEDLVALIVEPLGSLLSGVNQTHTPIRALHTSFFQFLQDKGRSKAYFVDHTQHNRHLTLASLQVMKSKLQFNICDVKDSHVRNTDLPDLPARVQQHIKPHLSYSCRFWGDHLRECTYDEQISGELWKFVRQYFLYWLEVLSLIKHVNGASKSLASIVTWNKNQHPNLTVFVQDAIRFVDVFAPPISQSVAHIYLSALPFTPASSLVGKQYIPQYPTTLRLRSGKLDQWPAAIKTFEGHTNEVNSVACSPDGKHIVSGSHDWTIQMWDAETGEAIGGPFRGHSYIVFSVAYSPNGKHIASGSADQTIQVWDAMTGEVVGVPCIGHSDWVRSIAYSPDGKYIVSGSDDKTLRVWNVVTSENIQGPFEGHSEGVRCVAYSPDGKQIVSGSDDQTIRMWNAVTGEPMGVPFAGHSGVVKFVVYSPDGKHILSSSDDKTIRVWDAETGQTIGEPFEGHSGSVTSVAYSLDGKHIVSGSEDRTVRVWEAATGEAMGAPFEGHNGPVSSVAYSSDGQHIISGSGDNTIRVWDAVTRGEAMGAPFTGHSSGITSVTYSPDGKHIVSGSHDKTIRVWDGTTGEAMGEPFEGHYNLVTCVAYSPDGTHIVSGSYDNTIRVWDTETGEAIGEPFKGHSGTVYSVAYSPDGKHIVSGSDDETIRVWDAQTGDAMRGPFQGHSYAVRCVAYSPDGKHIVSGSRGDNTIRVCNAETGEAIGEPFKGHSGTIDSVAYSPDGTRIVSGSWDKTIRVWDTETGEAIGEPFEGHTDSVTSVAYSRDGKYVVSGSHDKTIRVWNAATGGTIGGPFQGHSNWVNSVAYSPDGTRIVSGSNDQTIRVWDAETIQGASESRLAVDPASRDTFSDQSALENGWVCNSSSELLFWMPAWSRAGLLWPKNTAVIASNPTRLDLENFVHGSDWQRCKQLST